MFGRRKRKMDKRALRDKQIENLTSIVEYGFGHSHNGTWVAKLEEKCKEFYHKKYAIAQCNGTATLHTALLAAGVGKGDYVITTPLTMSSPNIAIALCGATPIYIDVDEKTWLLDCSKIKRSMLEKSKAIIGVSLYGLPFDFAWFNKHLKAANPNIVTINDSAEQLKPYDCGADIVSLSFQASKQLNCGEGGMVLTDNQTLAAKIRSLANLGYPVTTNIINKNSLLKFHTDRHLSLGYNYRMSDLQAAYLLPQFDFADEIFHSKVYASEEYNEIFSKHVGIIPQARGMKSLLENHSYWTYAVDAGVYAEKLLTLNDVYSSGFTKVYPVWELSYKEKALKMDASCPVAEKLSSRIVQFPTNHLWDVSGLARALENIYA